MNALGFAGLLAVRGDEDLALVRAVGPLEVLGRVGGEARSKRAARSSPSLRALESRRTTGGCDASSATTIGCGVRFERFSIANRLSAPTSDAPSPVVSAAKRSAWYSWRRDRALSATAITSSTGV